MHAHTIQPYSTKTVLNVTKGTHIYTYIYIYYTVHVQLKIQDPSLSHRPSKRSNIINNPIPLTINTPLQTMVGLVLDVFILGRKMAQAFGVFKIRGKGLVIVTIRLKSPVKIKIHHNPHQVNGQNPHVQSC